MPHNINLPSIEQALASVRAVALQNRASKGSVTRTALHEAVVLAVRVGAKQARVVEASGLSKAQVSRVARGGSSGNSQLPPAEYLIDTLPADEVIERYRAGESTHELGVAYGCSRTTISDILKSHGVPRDHPAGRSRVVLPEAEILERYKQGESFRKIGRSYGVSGELIRRRVREAQQVPENTLQSVG